MSFFFWSSLWRVRIYQHGCQEHSTESGERNHREGLLCETGPLPEPGARHDLMKSCLPQARAAAFKILLKTQPRWPRHSLPVQQERGVRPSQVAALGQGLSGLHGSPELRVLRLPPHPVPGWQCCQPRCWGPERGLIVQAVLGYQEAGLSPPWQRQICRCRYLPARLLLQEVSGVSGAQPCPGPHLGLHLSL